MNACRSVVRQLGKPALLAATYKGDAAGIAAAAMEEVEATLVNCLHELERLSLISGGVASLYPRQINRYHSSSRMHCTHPRRPARSHLSVHGYLSSSCQPVPARL